MLVASRTIILTSLLIFLNAVLPSFGFPRFQQLIPNGDKVTDPCDGSTVWNGVGHFNKVGGGERNVFGKV